MTQIKLANQLTTKEKVKTFLGITSNTVSGGDGSISKTFVPADFATDGGTGYYAAFTDAIPANALVIGIVYDITTAFNAGLKLTAANGTLLAGFNKLTADVVADSIKEKTEVITLTTADWTTYTHPALLADILPTAGSVTITVMYTVPVVVAGTNTTTQDDLIDMLINNVSNFIEGFCGNRHFLSQTFTDEIHDAIANRGTTDGSILFLHQYPVSSVTKVEYRSGTIASPTWITYDANSYMLYAREGYIKFFGVMPNISQGLRVTYVAGYKIDFTNEGDTSLHTLPFDLTMAATEIVARKYQLRQSQGIKAQAVEGQSVTMDDSMTADQKAVLKNYAATRLSI